MKPSSPTSKSSAQPRSHSRLRSTASPSGRFKTGDVEALHLNRSSLTSTTACGGLQSCNHNKSNNHNNECKGKYRQLDARVSLKPQPADAPSRANSSQHDDQHSFRSKIVTHPNTKVRCTDILTHYKGSADFSTAKQEKRAASSCQVADDAASHWPNRGTVTRCERQKAKSSPEWSRYLYRQVGLYKKRCKHPLRCLLRPWPQ